MQIKSSSALLRAYQFIFSIMTFLFLGSSAEVWGLTSCSAIFPDGASNFSATGEIKFNWDAKIVNSPDAILSTLNLNDGGRPGTSCDTSACSQSNSTSTQGPSFNSFVSGAPQVSLGYRQTQVLNPGDYGSLSLGTEAEIYFDSGTYTFNGSFTLGYLAKAHFAANSVVTFYVKTDIDIHEAEFNVPDGAQVLLVANDDINLHYAANVNAVLYAVDDITVENSAVLTGAASAGGRITLESGALIDFDSTSMDATFASFCEGGAFPVPIGYWPLDETTWVGSSSEILDLSGNNLHGRAINLNGVPTTQVAAPAIAGDPGTCRSGNFHGTSDGYAQIDDPGSNSIMDQPEFTVAFWFYTRTYPGSDLKTIISKNEQFEVNIKTTGQLEWWWGGGAQMLTSSGSVSLSTWHHLAITYKSGEQRMYLDGALFASHSTTQALTYNNLPIYIGTDYNFHSRRLDGYVDELQYYDSVLTSTQVNSVMNQTHVCPVEPSTADFSINLPNTASTCTEASVLISVLNGSGQTLTNYTGSIDISTSTGNGDWAMTGTASDGYGTLTTGSADSGSATYQFAVDGSDQGTVRLNLANVHRETLTVAVNGDGVTSVSSPTTFSDNVFVVESVDSLGEDIVAGRPHQLRLQMLKNDAATGECGPAAGYNVNQIKVWLTPTANDPGGQAPTLVNAAQSQSLVLPNGQPGTVNFNAGFSSGVALIALETSDVGAFTLNVQDDSTDFADQAIVGSSNVFTARPFAIDVSVPGNPAATDGSGAVFAASGLGFSVQARAVLWQRADDGNDDGIADGHDDTDPDNNANLADNPAAVSFGQEFPPETVRLSADLIAPATGNPGSLLSTTTPADGTLLDSFSGGLGATNAVTYTEVGVIEVGAALGDSAYLASSTAVTSKILGRSGYVGRFTPSYFDVTAKSIDPFCSDVLDFSYLSQFFIVNLTVEAKNSLGGSTLNYRDDFVQYGASLGTNSFSAVDSGVTPLSTRVVTSTVTAVWVGGVGQLAVPTAVLRGSAPDGPFSSAAVGAIITDADGISFLPTNYDLDVDGNGSADSIAVGQTYLKYGRLLLNDAYGPETANLPVTFQAQYWDGSDWRQNEDDSCSEIPLTAIHYPTGNLSVAANRIVTLGVGQTEGHYGVENVTTIGFDAGDAGQYFTAPGAGNTGNFSVDVDLSSLIWLRYDWDQDGDYENDAALPSANFHFGVYRGHDRILYWQEVLH